MTDPEAGRRGALLVALAACLWGTNGTARALGPDAASPIAVGAVRMVGGGAVLVAVAVARGFRPRWREWATTRTAVAVLAMAAYQPLFFGGVSRAGVAVGTVVGIGTSPIAGGVLGRLVRREPLDRRWLAATALGLAGAALLATAGGGGAGDDLAAGLALAIGAGVAWAVYLVATADLVEQRDTGEVTAVVFGAAGLLLVPVALVSGVGWVGTGGGALLAAHLCLVTTAVAYPLCNRGLRSVGAARAATLSLAEPATAAVLGLAVLDERLAALGWAGLALVAAGVVVLASGQVRNRSSVS